MKLYEYIKDNVKKDIFVTESFGSEKLGELIKNNQKSNFWRSSYVKKYLQWDKITDDDVVEMPSADAVKLVYKKSGPSPFVIWVTSRGSILCASRGLDILSGYENNIKSARTASQWSSIAYVIEDYQKFETHELRNQRKLQKEGALSLKSDLQVAEENHKRWEEEKAKAELEKRGDENSKVIIALVQPAVDRFNAMIEKITNNPDFAANYYKYSYRLRDLNKEFNSIMEQVSLAMHEDKMLSMYGNNGFYSIKSLKDSVNTLEQRVNNFIIKYDLEQ